MDRKKFIEPILYLALIVALLAPRLPSLNSFVTLDEPYWLSMGANFYYALGQREFQNTVYEYQPAVTTMWIVTAAMLVYFPEYRGMGQGYLEFEKGALDPFLLAHGKDPLALFYIARLLQTFLIVALFLVLYYFLRRILSRPIAFFAVLFASFDPYFLGQSRLLNHEAMLSLFVVISVLAFYIYLSHGRKLGVLIFSGIMAGLAQLTKSSAIAILAPVGVLFLIQIFYERRQGLLKALINNAKIFALWLGALVVAYFVFWPGMWVAPQKMIYEVYGNAFSYAFQGARLKAAGDLETSRFAVDLNSAGFLSLIITILRRTTPLTWLGVLLSPLSLWEKDKTRERNILFTLLWITAAAFVIMFGVARGRNSPHYLLCSYLALNLLAGLGWFYFVQQISKRFSFGKLQQVQYVALFFLLSLQMWSAASAFPYYFTYQNPFYQHDENFPLFPYGEGLELAGKYLSDLPNAKNSTALVYYARGCFSYFYTGETTRFKPYYADGVHAQDLLDSIKSSDYLVVYYA
ncbi:MAG: glycosyltransferase family 39 protein, partial [Anaerolineales bacterium]|nr:glycosyltransferase family 39 protein [Anaerolineales bacterium]